MPNVSRLMFAVLFMALSGCTSNLVTRADSLAQNGRLKRVEVPTDTFLLTTYVRTNDHAKPFNIYIEGDGMAWLSEFEPSMNPTPREALTLALATRDPAPNVIYIARPCQFTPLERDRKCAETYWTNRRFSEEVITAVYQAVDKLMPPNKARERKINLIGYSGGGAVAALVAARRDDVASLRTVAGNLDHAEFTRLHNNTPLHESLNALDVATKLATIPQIHFSGGKDDVVSPSLAERFRAASGPTTCITLRILETATHKDGWIERWPNLLNQTPTCER